MKYLVLIGLIAAAGAFAMMLPEAKAAAAIAVTLFATAAGFVMGLAENDNGRKGVHPTSR